MVVAPDSPNATFDPDVLRLPSLPMPGYGDVRCSRFAGRASHAVTRFSPDVLYVASPAVLGGGALRYASGRGLASVAIFQTDLARFACAYGLGWSAPTIWRRLVDIHRLATRTLAPSRRYVDELVVRGVHDVAVWRRGVDTSLFHPGRRDLLRRAELARGANLVVGSVGRLAPEKRHADLAELARTPGVQLVIVGDGPEHLALRRQLPGASFTGYLSGTQLAETVASFDVLVHPGRDETFCQAAQEALACGVPVVAVDSGGLPDVVRHNVTGTLVPVGDVSSLTSAVLAYHDAELLRRQSLAAPRTVTSWSEVIDELEEHLAEVAAVPVLGRTG
jgi:phosphatidylinositol alpha 1,6-mannosyltransferase